MSSSQDRGLDLGGKRDVVTSMSIHLSSYLVGGGALDLGGLFLFFFSLKELENVKYVRSTTLTISRECVNFDEVEKVMFTYLSRAR